MQDNCQDHSGCITDIANLKTETNNQWKTIDHMKTKLNMILGAAIISPFIVAVLTLLIAAAVLGNGSAA